MRCGGIESASEMTTLLSVTNADDSRTPSFVNIQIRYVQDEDSVPVERHISKQVPVPCYSFPVYTGEIRKISWIVIEISFGDTYLHEYTWLLPSTKNGKLQVSLQKGDRHPRVSLNGVNASRYSRELSSFMERCICLLCLWWLPPSCFCCCHDNYVDKNGEYETL